jgi:CheY-like chemotaxis protein
MRTNSTCTNVLIVEHDLAQAYLLQLTLQHVTSLPDATPLGWATVPSIPKAYTWLAEQPDASVAVIVIDRHLIGGDDGLTLVQQLRVAPLPALHSAAVIILWSAHDEEPDQAAAYAAGADAFLSKKRMDRVSVGKEVHTIVEQMWYADDAGQLRPWIALV